MAYGVKFRLEFSDDNLKGKKIEILQDGYTGTVYDLIGTDNPLEIEWNSNDDIYSPIIGSTCQINLFVTDSTNYDNFYDADEREYKIKISYKDASLVYQTYWEGWLLVDQFKEALTHTPYRITLSGYDGLGSLDGFDIPMDTTSTGQKSFMYYIHNILNNLDLGFDIYVSNDIKKNGASAGTYNIYDQSLVTPYYLLNNQFDLASAKDTLEQILKFTNARIFQSYGRWYVINNSSYSEQSVKDSSNTTAQTGSVPTGIRASETSSLQTNGTETIEYHIYNSSGVYQSSSDIDVLNQVPSDLQPLNNNLTKEYLRPLREVLISHDVSQFNEVNEFSNSGFEHGSTNWTFTDATLDSTITKQGNYSAKNTDVQTSETGTGIAISQSIDKPSASHLAYVLKINAYLNSTYTGNRSFRWQLKHDETGVPGGTDIYYWSVSGNNWTTTNTINIETIEQNNRWLEFSHNIDTLPNPVGALVISIYEPYQQATTGFTSIHYDNITFDFERIDANDNRTPFFSPLDRFTYKRFRTTDYSGIYEIKDIKLSNDKYSNVSGDYYRSRDNHSTLFKSIEEITTQQIFNDYRDFVLRYEGDVYNLNNDPIGPHNKIWINFGTSILQEPVSCYIDSLRYNVKRNTYTATMHVPNQDDDLSTSFKVNF